MAAFWDESWSRVDVGRLNQYIDTFCDAGCGCGIYSYQLIAHGFTVSGFDVSSYAVHVAKKLLERVSATADLKTASILNTGYCCNQFDAVVSRDVIDHMNRKDGISAVNELYRITKPGGAIFITLDHLDSEYETEPHGVNDDGDYVFSDGKWKGMVFHPYSRQEIHNLIPKETIFAITEGENGFIVKIVKQ